MLTLADVDNGVCTAIWIMMFDKTADSRIVSSQFQSKFLLIP